MSSTYTDKNNPCSRCTNKYSQLGTFSQPCCNRISQIVFSIKVLSRWPCKFSFREERLGHPYSTMIEVICVLTNDSKCLDIPIWEFSIIWVHPPFFLAVNRYCVSCLSCAIKQSSLEMIPMTFAAVICDTDDPCSVNTAYDAESSFTIFSRNTTRPLYFWCLASNSAFFKWHVYQWCKMNFCAHRPGFIDDLFFLLLTFVKFHAEIFSNFSHSWCTAAFGAGIFKEKIVT